MIEPTRVKNIEAGEIWAVLVLSKLIERWPSKLDLRNTDLDEIIKKSGVDIENGKTNDAIYGLLNWLEIEGYIRVSKKINGGARIGCALTEKALVRLNQLPSGLGGQSLKDSIVEAAGDVAKEGAKNTFGDLFGQVIGGFTKSMSSQ